MQLSERYEKGVYRMKRTPLYETYRSYSGVKLIDFGGWELPVHFSEGITAEHNAVRSAAGIFDVSHMGEVIIRGSGSRAYLQYLVTNDISALAPGTVIYSPMCYPDGTVVDDLIIYCLAEEHFLLVVNAANTDKDYAWISAENPLAAEGRIPGSPEIENCSSSWCQIAVQGPKAVNILEKVYPQAQDVKFFTFHRDVRIADAQAIVSRTGYTGEDGFEIYADSGAAAQLWNSLLEAGAPYGLMPCGLGARDTLRLEAKLPLYGHEISSSITPLEANLGYFVNLEAGDFCGRDALLAQQASGIPRTLRGISMVDRGVAREGYPVFEIGGEEAIGYVTSGAKSPVLDQFVALILIKRGTGLKIGDTLEVEIHGRRRKAELVKTPFYKKRYVQAD
jgi:aminomethyltransferase